jgi:dipeptidyl aminopeptidase/acylaminoacyl peptidase
MEQRSIIGDYVNRMPRDLFALLRHATPVVVLLAVFAFFRRRSFLLAGFVPLLFFPFFTFRTEPRFVFPYVPVLILYAVIGISTVEKRRMRILLAVLLCASAVSGIALNRDQLTRPVSDGFQWAKEVGRSFEDRIAPGDKIADRKPYFAFYAGGEYFEIPVAPINQTLEHLASNDVAYLVLHPPTIQMMRPQLLPMIYDPMYIRSEMRYSPVISRKDVLIYRKELDADPLIRRQITPPHGELLYSPRWSPDGAMIAFRSITPSGEGAIHIIDPGGGEIQRLATARGIDDPITWAPDSKRIAFATGGRGSMNIDIAVYHLTGEIEYVTSHKAIDVSPSWSADGSEIIFSSTRTGENEIWSKHLGTGALERITTEGGGSYPSISPDGKWIAWIREGEGLYLLDRDSGVVTRAAEPRSVNFTPSWSHDGSFIAVTGSDWGKMDVYLVTADGRHAVLLTKTTRREGQPGWSPDDNAIVTVTIQDDAVTLSVLTGIEAYKYRLLSLAWNE